MTTIHGASGAARRAAGALSRWEGEGGALDARDGVRDPLGKNDLRILGRLSVARRAGLNILPTELQRVLLRRTSTPPATADRAPRSLRAHKSDALGD